MAFLFFEPQGFLYERVVGNDEMLEAYELASQIAREVDKIGTVRRYCAALRRNGIARGDRGCRIVP